MTRDSGGTADIEGEIICPRRKVYTVLLFMENNTIGVEDEVTTRRIKYRHSIQNPTVETVAVGTQTDAQAIEEDTPSKMSAEGKKDEQKVAHASAITQKEAEEKNASQIEEDTIMTTATYTNRQREKSSVYCFLLPVALIIEKGVGWLHNGIFTFDPIEHVLKHLHFY